MNTLNIMLNQHPRALPTSRDSYADAISELTLCEQVCTSCADACLGEPEQRTDLIRCIRLSQDCADICDVTARLLARHTATDNTVVQAQLHACVLACQACADECFSHASMHGHCATCSKSCRACRECCSRLLEEIAASDFGADATPARGMESR